MFYTWTGSIGNLTTELHLHITYLSERDRQRAVGHQTPPIKPPKEAEKTATVSINFTHMQREPGDVCVLQSHRGKLPWEWLTQEYRNVATKKKTDEQTTLVHKVSTPRKFKVIQKDAFNSPYTVCGTTEVYKCAQIGVSALFSAFLRLFELRELAKLVGQPNLFRDLGSFFPFFFFPSNFSP